VNSQGYKDIEFEATGAGNAGFTIFNLQESIFSLIRRPEP
jgi:hypothetical protein